MPIDIMGDLARTFGAVEADVKKASAGMLTKAALQAQANAIADSIRVFDRPRDFSTKNAYAVARAKASDGDRMFSELKVKPTQAQYLWLEIEGGTRVRGDPGATRYDVPVGADPADTDAYGGIARNTAKKWSRKNKAEKKARATAALRVASAHAAVAAATTTAAKLRLEKRLHALLWVSKSRNAPGVFFGAIDGVKGYWQRPARTLTPAVRHPGVRTVHDVGKPQLMLAFARKARYRPLFNYDKAMYRAAGEAMTSAAFAAELARVQSGPTGP